MVYAAVLKKLVNVLRREGVVHVVTGTLAVGYYGVARSTVDIDVLVVHDEAGFRRMMAHAKRNGFRVVEKARPDSKKIVLESREGYRVNLWVAGTEHDLVTLKQMVKKQLLGIWVNLVAPEDLIIQKLKSARPKDLLDIVAVMARQGGRLDVDYLRAWARELGAEGVFSELEKKVW